MKYLQKIYEFIWSLCAVNYWLTKGCVNKYYDKWCRQQLKDGIMFTDLTEHTVKMNGVKVWIANHPFASFRTYNNPRLTEMHPSRYTKRLLKKELDKQVECSAINYLNRLTVKRRKQMPDIFLLMEAETRQGVFEHSLINIGGLTHKQIHEQILLFVEDVYDTDGNKDFLADEYYQINFDELFNKQHLLVNQCLHLSVLFGVNDFRLGEIL